MNDFAVITATWNSSTGSIQCFDHQDAISPLRQNCMTPQVPHRNNFPDILHLIWPEASTESHLWGERVLLQFSYLHLLFPWYLLSPSLLMTPISIFFSFLTISPNSYFHLLFSWLLLSSSFLITPIFCFFPSYDIILTSQSPTLPMMSSWHHQCTISIYLAR